MMMAVSLAACTPTTEKQKKQTTQAAKDTQEIVPQSTGGASDKVPDPNVMPVAVVPYTMEGTLTAWYRIWIPLTQRGWMPSFW